jgi:putative glycosyltransferase (TIGR04372 family)
MAVVALKLTNFLRRRLGRARGWLAEDRFTALDERLAELAGTLRIRTGRPASLTETFHAAWYHSSRDRPDLAIPLYERYGSETADPNAYSHLAVERLLGFGDYRGAMDAWRQQEEIKSRAHDGTVHPGRPITFFNRFWGIAIGHIAHMDYRIRAAVLAGRTSADMFMLWPPLDRVANRALLDLWRPYVTMATTETDLPYPVTALANVEENYYVKRVTDGRLLYFWQEAAELYEAWDRSGRGSLVRLPPDWHSRAPAALRDLGVPENGWHVCLHVRASGFHKHHRERMSSLNASIASYVPAIREILSRGGTVIRMGDSSMPPLPKMKGVVDYAHSPHRADWLDVYLCATARFFIGTSSGLGYVPALFDVPCVLTNWAPVGTRPWRARDLYIPKLHRDRRTRALVPFSRSFAPPLGYVHVPRMLHGMGMELVDNSPDEISEVVREMLGRLEGNIPGSADHPARVKFDEIAASAGCSGRSMPGADFLDRYAELLQ